MEDEFHRKKREEKANAIQQGSSWMLRRRGISGLRDVVVESDYRPSDEEWRVKGVGNIVAKGKGVHGGRDRDAIPLRKGRGIKLLLLRSVSIQ